MRIRTRLIQPGGGNVIAVWGNALFYYSSDGSVSQYSFATGEWGPSVSVPDSDVQWRTDGEALFALVKRHSSVEERRVGLRSSEVKLRDESPHGAKIFKLVQGSSQWEWMSYFELPGVSEISYLATKTAHYVFIGEKFHKLVWSTPKNAAEQSARTLHPELVEISAPPEPSELLLVDGQFLYSYSKSKTAVYILRGDSWVPVFPGISDVFVKVVNGPSGLVARGQGSSLYWYSSAAETVKVLDAKDFDDFSLTAVGLFAWRQKSVALSVDGTEWVPLTADVAFVGFASAGNAILGWDEKNAIYLVSAGGASHSSWMSDLRVLYPELGTRSLPQICMPGTHDSGCYEPMVFDEPWTSMLLVAKAFADRGMAGVYAPMTTTQRKNILEQLQSGARYFDLRPNVDADGNYRIYHGLFRTNTMWSDVIEQFNTFLDKNPGEIVVASINHLSDIGPPGPDLCLRQFYNALGRFVATSADFKLSATYDEIVSKRKNIFVFADSYGNLAPDVRQFCWDASNIFGMDAYANSDILESLLLDIVIRIRSAGKNGYGSNPGQLWMLQCQMTPHGANPFPLSLADKSKSSVQSIFALGSFSDALLTQLDPDALLKIRQKAREIVNFFIVDDYDSSWANLAIDMNIARLEALGRGESITL